jgi:D-alanyl-D-alanine carboxypeptidase
MTMFALPFLLALAAVAAHPSPAETAPPPPVAVTPDVRARVEREMTKLAGTARGQSPALGVAIVQRGTLVYEHAFGGATSQTRFRIGSITKLCTAVSVMQLVQAHRIDLDATVATYVPTAPYATQITVRQLLQHTSGLWNYGDEVFANGAVRKPTAPQAILTLVAAHPLTAQPGKTYAYSNSGYVVLGLIVEHVSGKSLSSYEQTHIFVPAGMHATTFGTPPAPVPIATGYLSARGPVAPEFDGSWLFGDGDIVSTAGDLGRFDIALLDGTLVNARTLSRMQADHVEAGSGARAQGLGLQLASVLGMPEIGHHGGVPGFEASNAMLPASGLAVVVLSNAFDFNTARANAAIFAALFPSLPAPTVPAGAQVENAAITAQFRAALMGILRGRIDRLQYSDAVSAALTPELLTQTAAELAPLGTIAETTYVGRSNVGELTVYQYDVLFSGGKTLRWNLSIGRDGKIAGIASAG